MASALASFSGVKRRMELVGRPRGIAVLDDFAHHPTAVAKTLQALKNRFPFRRLIVAFEPRSLTAAQKLFFEEYCAAFSHADLVFFAPIFHAERFADDELLDLGGISARLSLHGTQARSTYSIDDLTERILGAAQPGDVIVTMSSGSFDGLPRRLVNSLAGST